MLSVAPDQGPRESIWMEDKGSSKGACESSIFSRGHFYILYIVPRVRRRFILKIIITRKDSKSKDIQFPGLSKGHKGGFMFAAVLNTGY